MIEGGGSSLAPRPLRSSALSRSQSTPTPDHSCVRGPGSTARTASDAKSLVDLAALMGIPAGEAIGQVLRLVAERRRAIAKAEPRARIAGP